ncbi:MAG: 4-hydroxy-tetrahydrodipicolinate reductase [Armatimonadetes bacterium]|nr:4-hydroxy-tetrahydrodipicolinate reductase [Armatimonadota bacterium]
MVKVAVAGACGRMGQESLRALGGAPEFEVVAAVDKSNPGESARSVAGSPAPDIAIHNKLGESLDATKPDVLLDLTHASCAADNTVSALKRRIAVVIGTSGLSNEDLSAIREACMTHETPALLVPNFAIGAILMMRFAEQAAKWFPSAEIIELHHDGKADSPSGTATRTAEMIAAARESVPRRAVGAVEKFPGARGAQVKGIQTHSVRLPGLVAHQEVLFGGPGELLTIRHDSMNRGSFMEGVKYACREVRGLNGFVVGLDKLMFR